MCTGFVGLVTVFCLEQASTLCCRLVIRHRSCVTHRRERDSPADRLCTLNPVERPYTYTYITVYVGRKPDAEIVATNITVVHFNLIAQSVLFIVWEYSLYSRFMWCAQVPSPEIGTKWCKMQEFHRKILSVFIIRLYTVMDT